MCRFLRSKACLFRARNHLTNVTLYTYTLREQRILRLAV
jgi:hypothetical protein